MKILGNDIPMPESPAAKFWMWTATIAGGTIALWLFLVGYFMVRAEAMANEKVMREEYTYQIKQANEQIAQANAATAKAVDDVRMQIEFSADTNAKRSIDNQLFTLEQIPYGQMKPEQRAVYEKLKRDRQELVNLWNRRGRPLR